MTSEEAALWAVIVFMIIAGVWLAGLTYLMWRMFQKKIKGAEAKPPAEESSPPEKTE